jgi:hypothetical protein
MENRRPKSTAGRAAKTAKIGKVGGLVAVLIAMLGLPAACSRNGATPAATPGAEPVMTVVLTPLPADQPVSPLQGVSLLPTPTPQQRIAADSLALEKGKAAVIGRVISRSTGQPLANVQLRLGEIYCPDGATDLTEAEKRIQCMVILSDAWNPYAETDAEGRFSFVNIEARDYTLMVGFDTAVTTSVTALNDQGDPIIYTAIADETVDVGDVTVDYQP